MKSSNNLFEGLLVGIIVGSIGGIVIYIIGRFLGMSSAGFGAMIGGIVGAVSVTRIRKGQSALTRSSTNQLLLAALLLGAATGAQAQSTAFVSAVNGVDGGSCTVAAPCRTVNFAITQIPSGGQVLIIDSGDYIEAFTGPQGSNTLRVIVRDSLFNRSGVAVRGNASTGGSVQVDLERCEITNSQVGVVSAFTGSTARVSNSTITGNTTGLLPASGGLLLSRSNNTVEANTTNGNFTGFFVAK